MPADNLTTDEAEAWRRGAEAMREACAQDADCACPERDAVLSAETKAARWVACRQATCAALAARDIRALPIPPPPRDLTADGLCERGA